MILNSDQQNELQPLLLKRHRKVNSESGSLSRRFFLFFVFVAALLLVIVLLLAIYKVVTIHTKKCLGPPYLYVTHDNSRNILKLSRNGCLLQKRILWGVNNEYANLRCMTLTTYRNNKNALLVTTADQHGSGVTLYGDCSYWSGYRVQLQSVISYIQNLGAYHAYGITVNDKKDIYVSFQETDVVLRFDGKNFSPITFPIGLKPLKIPSPKSVNDDNVNSNSSNNNDQFFSQSHRTDDNIRDIKFFDGTFVQFGLPGMHSVNEQGIRSIVWVNNNTELWIANEDLNKVVIVNKNGQYISHISIKKPIGLFSSESDPVVYVGSKASKSSGVYAIDKITLSIVKTYKLIGMNHPTGIVAYHDVLYVADQTRNTIVSFNITTQRFLKLILNPEMIELTGSIEQLMLSPC